MCRHSDITRPSLHIAYNAIIFINFISSSPLLSFVILFGYACFELKTFFTIFKLWPLANYHKNSMMQKRKINLSCQRMSFHLWRRISKGCNLLKRKRSTIASLISLSVVDMEKLNSCCLVLSSSFKIISQII